MTIVQKLWELGKSLVEKVVGYPMAAPETPELKKARKSVIFALSILGVLCFFWHAAFAIFGVIAFGSIVGLVVFLFVQVPVWLAMKVRADDAWLTRNRETEDA